MKLTTNKYVAVEPFPPKSIKTATLKGGLIGVGQKVELQSLKVILNSEDGRFKSGMTVWVRADLAAQDFAGIQQTIDGQTFVLMPDNFILLFDTGN